MSPDHVPRSTDLSRPQSHSIRRQTRTATDRRHVPTRDPVVPRQLVTHSVEGHAEVVKAGMAEARHALEHLG
jgi:hypothetical protein